MNRYYLTINNEAAGPYTLPQLTNMWNAGQVTMDTPVCLDGAPAWSTMESMLPVIDPDNYGLDHKLATVMEIKKAPQKRWVYVLIGLFFGSVGVHNFYSQHNSSGYIKLGVMIVFLCMLMLEGTNSPSLEGDDIITNALIFAGMVITLSAFLMPFWALLEIFSVKETADGRRMR